jgi:hypothetical protein
MTPAFKVTAFKAQLEAKGLLTDAWDPVEMPTGAPEKVSMEFYTLDLAADHYHTLRIQGLAVYKNWLS